MNARLTTDHCHWHRNGVAHCRSGAQINSNADQEGDPIDLPQPAITGPSAPSRRQPDHGKLIDEVANGAAATSGPGNELKRMLPWLSKANESGIINRRIATINQWGAKGCRLNLETIAAWLVQEAVKQEMDDDELTLDTARALVLTSIRRYERKFPDGPLETD
ncbi:hypothetical protein [Rhodopirellula europaea]|uniref:hypothetical protein n=1 Tax=Rhodopirellula europaea TaxID=1263866 RepID=UPI003D2A05CA